LANLTANKEVREVVLDPKHKLLENTILSVFSLEPNRRKGVLKTYRNCFFEWENAKVMEYLLDPKYKVLDNFLKCLAFCLMNLTLSLGKEDAKLNEICKKLGIIIDPRDEAPKTESCMEDIDVIVDMFLVLSNVNQELAEEDAKSPVKFDKDLAYDLINRTRKFITKEEVLNKIDVICLVFFKEAPAL